MFKKAERKQAKLKIALTGPSGSGKTYSALTLAKAIGKKIAVVDTENESASLYSDRFEFDTAVMSSPYLVSKYTAAIKEAEKNGYDVLVIDSITHAWAGEGGLLSKKEALDARGGNSYTNWSSVSKEHEQFKSALVNANIHLICTMRSKQDYVMLENDKGKMAPKKVGMAPIQRDGMEYEFTTVFDIGMDHVAATSKDRTGLFDGLLEPISERTGKSLVDWLNSAKKSEQKLVVEPPKEKSITKVPAQLTTQDELGPKPQETKQPAKTEAKAFLITDIQLQEIAKLARGAGWKDDEIKTKLSAITKKPDSSAWTAQDHSAVLAHFAKLNAANPQLNVQ